MHGLTDTFSDLFTLIITAEMFRSPRVTKHLGEGTVERFGGLCISILMLLGGAWTLWLSLVEVCLICFPQTAPLLQTINLFTQNSAGEHVAPDARAALFVLANIAAKDWIYRASKFCPQTIAFTRLRTQISHKNCQKDQFQCSRDACGTPAHGLYHSSCDACFYRGG